jgi:hypothetical protein
MEASHLLSKEKEEDYHQGKDTHFHLKSHVLPGPLNTGLLSHFPFAMALTEAVLN